jgi:hypothetical protein
MNVTNTLYPQFWLQLEIEHVFFAQLSILKSHYYMRHKRVNFVFIPWPLFDETLLDQQTFFLKNDNDVKCGYNYEATPRF